MIMTVPIFMFISSGVALTALGLGTYVMAKSPRMAIARLFFVLMVLLATVSFLDFLYNSASSYEEALWLMRISNFCQVVTYGGFLYLVSFFVVRSEGAVFRRNAGRYLLIVIASGVAGAALATPRQSGFGWYYPNTYELFLFGIINLIYLSFALKALNRTYRRPMEREESIIVASVAFAMIIPFALLTATMLLEFFGQIIPTPMAPLVLITAIIFSNAIVSSKIFEVVPAKEISGPAVNAKGLGLERGRSYIIEGKSADLSYRLFTAEVGSGANGLIVSTMHPEQVRTRYGLSKTPVLWLAQCGGRECINPKDISHLEHTVARFISEGDKPVILLDGLDLIAMENDRERALRLIFDLEDKVTMSGGHLIVPIDPEAMPARERALLVRNMMVLDGERQAYSQAAAVDPLRPKLNLS